MTRTTWDSSRYLRSQLLSGLGEEAVVQEILEWAWVKHRLVGVVIDAGAKKLRGRAAGALTRAGAGKAAIAKMNAGQTGAGCSGLSDIVFHLKPSGRAIWVEVKRRAWHRVDGTVQRPHGRPTLEQVAFLEARASEGCLVTCAWGWQDLDDLLSSAASVNIELPPASGFQRSE
jgi:hypothetical protein